MTEHSDTQLIAAQAALTRARLEVHEVAFTMREIADALLDAYDAEVLAARAGHELRELADRLHREQR